jgi:hypothetical protein
MSTDPTVIETEDTTQPSAKRKVAAAVTTTTVSVVLGLVATAVIGQINEKIQDRIFKNHPTIIDE